MPDMNIQKAVEMVTRNIGEIGTGDIQEKASAKLASMLNARANNESQIAKATDSADEIAQAKATKLNAKTLKQLMKAQTATPAGQVHEVKETKEKLTKEQQLEKAIANLNESQKLLVDITQSQTYDAIDAGGSAEDVYEIVSRNYPKSAEKADIFLQKQINNLRNEARKTNDPDELATLDHGVKIFQDAQKLLYKERGRELQVTYANKQQAVKADPNLQNANADQQLYQKLIAAGNAHEFKSILLQNYDSFEKEILPVCSFVLHMASKEINQGQGSVNHAHLAETMKLVQNTQGLLSSFRASQEDFSTVVRSWDSEIALAA